MRTWIDFLLGLVVPVATSIFLVVSLVLRRPRREEPSLRGGEGEGSQLGICTPEEHERQLAEFDRELYGTPFPYFTTEQIAEQAELLHRQQLEPGSVIPLSNNEHLRRQQLAMAAMQNAAFSQAQNNALSHQLGGMHPHDPNYLLSQLNQQCPPSHYQQLGQSSLSGHEALGTPGLQLLEKLLGLSKNNKGGLS